MRTLPASTDYIKRLEDRIKLLEKCNSQSHQNQHSDNSSSKGSSADSVLGTTSSHEATISTSPESLTWLSTVPWEGYSSIITAEANTDLWPPNPTATFSPEIVPSFQELPVSTDTTFISENRPIHDTLLDYHRSTDSTDKPVARSFMQEVEILIMKKLGEATRTTSNILGQSCDNAPAQNQSRESWQENLHYALPTREQADGLLNSFWNYVHVLYPFLEKSQIEEDYAQVWNRNNSLIGEKSFLCLLNSIFAISSRYARPITPDHDQSAAMFFSRAQDLLNFEACSIRSVQSYLLLALYFQSKDEFSKCWIFVGHAVRTAQILELHLFQTSERADETHRELYRKIWHSCVLMDREISMLYGRPSMIDAKAAAIIPLPSFIGEESFRLVYVDAHNIEKSQTDTVNFYSSCLDLYNIAHDVLDYNSNEAHNQGQSGRYGSEDKSFGTNASSIKLQERLATWENGNPDYLKNQPHSRYDDMNVVSAHQAVILHQRYGFI